MDQQATDARTQMVEWLLAGEARQAAKAELRRYGLDTYDASDLLNDVVLSVLQADLDAVVTNPVGYARRALTNRARDLLGADKARRRLVDHLPSHDDGPVDEVVLDIEDPVALDPQLFATALAIEDDLRRRLHLALARTRTWTVAAALTTLTLRLHDDVAVPDGAPAPEVGHRDKADRWAALWLAGEHGAFPDPAAGRFDGDAMRKARSRKLNAVDALLRDVFALGGGTDA